MLGGNGSTEVLVNPEGDTTREPLDPGEGGIIKEFRGNSQDTPSGCSRSPSEKRTWICI